MLQVSNEGARRQSGGALVRIDAPTPRDRTERQAFNQAQTYSAPPEATVNQAAKTNVATAGYEAEETKGGALAKMINGERKKRSGFGERVGRVFRGRPGRQAAAAAAAGLAGIGAGYAAGQSQEEEQGYR